MSYGSVYIGLSSDTPSMFLFEKKKLLKVQIFELKLVLKAVIFQYKPLF